MSIERIYRSVDYFQPAATEPIRSVVCESAEAVVVAWHVNPGQAISAHVHPHGQDTWTVLAGHGDYVLDDSGASRRINTGDVVIARTGSVHGVYNSGAEPLLFISVVSPADAGYRLV